MNRLLNFILLLVVGHVTATAQSVHEKYIEQYKQIALLEMERTGVPASIKLAQGLHESAIGKSLLATEANNHFGIKALDATWSGPVYYRIDDDRDPITGELIPSPFRKYDDPTDSFKDHSDFLRGRGRYSFLFELSPRDYKAWAYGLKEAGYATDPKYPTKIISSIEKWGLDRYDSALPLPPLPEEEVTVVLPPMPILIYAVNQTAVTEAGTDDTPLSLAARIGIEAQKIVEFNEFIDASDQQLQEGERVFLQKKKKEVKDGVRYHYVEKRESLYYIAQQYGVRLKYLARRNRMPQTAIPEVGQRIKLSGRKVKRKVRPTWKFPNEQIELPVPTDRDDQFHIVQSGDNLYRISMKYNLTIQKIIELNQLQNDSLRVGQRLKIK